MVLGRRFYPYVTRLRTGSITRKVYKNTCAAQATSETDPEWVVEPGTEDSFRCDLRDEKVVRSTPNPVKRRGRVLRLRPVNNATNDDELNTTADTTLDFHGFGDDDRNTVVDPDVQGLVDDGLNVQKGNGAGPEIVGLDEEALNGHAGNLGHVLDSDSEMDTDESFLTASDGGSVQVVHSAVQTSDVEHVTRAVQTCDEEPAEMESGDDEDSDPARVWHGISSTLSDSTITLGDSEMENEDGDDNEELRAPDPDDYVLNLSESSSDMSQTDLAEADPVQDEQPLAAGNDNLDLLSLPDSMEDERLEMEERTPRYRPSSPMHSFLGTIPGLTRQEWIDYCDFSDIGSNTDQEDDLMTF